MLFAWLFTFNLLQIEEKEESVWASSLSCLLYFVCDRGKIRRSRLNGLDIRVSLVFFPDILICYTIMEIQHLVIL